MSELSDRLARLPREKIELLLRELHARAGPMPNEEDPVVVVGIGCRFPGDANGHDEFLRVLRERVDGITPIPEDRREIYAAIAGDKATADRFYAREGGFVRDIDRADFRFFDIPAAEAALMDPQHRMLLEVAWEALESAGCPPDRLVGSATGVFVGISSADYAQLVVASGGRSRIGVEFGLGNAASLSAGRLCYRLGLHGPALAVDTACSSSLVAVHLARRSLLAGECDLALAAGVQAMLAPEMFLFLCDAGAIARDGQCRTFDASANGFARGEGCGVVVLRRLSAALAHGDPILAVLRGSAVNQDGRSNGMRAPSGRAQERVVREALDEAGIAPASVGYVEAHGTATLLGDCVEATALGAVLSRDRIGAPCRVGSVKTNFGHLEAAAGIAGLIKAVLSVHERTIFPSLHFVRPNPHVDWTRGELQVATEMEPWPCDGPAIAAVNAFSWCGTNAFVVVEEPSPEARARERQRPGQAQQAYVIPLSARDPDALRDASARCATWLAGHPDVRLHDVAYTAGARRAHLEVRAATVARTIEELREQLASWASTGAARFATGQRPARGKPKLVWLFARRADSRWTERQRLRSDRLRAFGLVPDAVVGDGVHDVLAAVPWLCERARAIVGSRERAVDVRELGSGIVVRFDEALRIDLPGRVDESSVDVGDNVHEAVAWLFAQGCDVDFASPLGDGRCLRLPTYPWRRQRAWWSDPIDEMRDDERRTAS
jgi:acyl transferase domain-containing protein